MKVIKVLEDATKEELDNSIFLAGPTHRVKEGQKDFSVSWRDEAINKLKELGFDGLVISPEWENNKKPDNWTYEKQINWEVTFLEKCKVILFWIPRSTDLLGLTTNIEFGDFMHSGKLVVGIPSESKFHVGYIKQRCNSLNIPLYDTMNWTCRTALDILPSKEESRNFFTSDLHFSAERTLQFSKRPFNDVHDMDKTIISNWNKVITNKDIVYVLGDLGNIEKFKQLNYYIVFLIKGNYDNDYTDEELSKYNITVLPSNTIMNIANKQDVELVHEPSNKSGKLPYLFGHIHRLGMIKNKGLNVGIDAHNYRPLSESDVDFYLNALLNHYDDEVFMK